MEDTVPLLTAREANFTSEDIQRSQQFRSVPTIGASIEPFKVEYRASFAISECITRHRLAFNFLKDFMDPPRR